MYAYIKYEKQCSRHSDKAIVSVHDIKHFKAKAINYSKLYNISCGSGHCTGLVLMVDQTIELLQKKIDSKRVAIPPKKMIASASDVTDDESQTAAAKVKSASQKQTGLKELVAGKVSAMKKKYDHPSTDQTGDDSRIENSSTSPVKTAEREGTSAALVNEDEADVNMSSTSVLRNVQKKPDDCKRKPKLQEKASAEIPSTSAAKTSEVNSVTPKKIPEKDKKIQEDGDRKSSLKSGPVKSSIPSKKKTANKSNGNVKPLKASETVESQTAVQTAKDVEVPTKSAKTTKKTREKTHDSRDLSNSITTKAAESPASQSRRDKESDGNQTSTQLIAEKHKNDGDSQRCGQCQALASKQKMLNKKLDEALKRIEELTIEKESAIASRDEEREISKQMQLLNIELQRNVIDFFNEVKANNSEVMKQAVTHVLQDESAVPVGHERKRNQTMHLGHGVWLKTSTYSAVVMNARTPAMFVKNMAVAVFGTSVLAMSSVSGKVSNRFKNDRSKDTVKARPKLNPMRMMAISAIFRHWLAKKKYEQVEIDLYVSKVGSMISHKIADLNRPAQKKKESNIDLSETVSDEDDPEEEADLTDDRNDAQTTPDINVGNTGDSSEAGSISGDASGEEGHDDPTPRSSSDVENMSVE